MDQELDAIDGILHNLAGIQYFYEQEYQHLETFHKLIIGVQSETIKRELANESTIFQTETSKELDEIVKKLNALKSKITSIKTDIQSRTESKQKLITLFNSLKNIESITGGTSTKIEPSTKVKEEKLDELPIMDIREELDDDDQIIKSELKPYSSAESELKKLIEEKSKQAPKQIEKKEAKNNKTTKDDDDDNDNNDDGNYVVSESSFRFLNKKEPTKSIETKKGTKEESNKEIKNEVNNGVKNKVKKEIKKKVKNANKNEIKNEAKNEAKNEPQSVEQKDEFRPFMIREEIDEDGNTIKSSVSRIPQMENQNTNNKIEELKEGAEDEKIDDDQLEELFEDMGFQIPNDLQEGSSKDADKDIAEVEEINVEIPETLSVEKNDLFTLELIADELNNITEENYDFKDDYGDMDDYELPDIQNGEYSHDDDEEEEEEEYDDEDDEDDEVDDEDVQKRTLSNMFGTKGQNLFAQKISELRNKKVGNNVPDIKKTETIEQATIISSPSSKTKKSVSFNNTVDIKQVPDIWDDLRKSNIENEKKSQANTSGSIFKRQINKPVENEITEDSDDDDVSTNVMNDIVERQITDTTTSSIPPNINAFKTFDPISLRKQLDEGMSEVDKGSFIKLGGKKTPSKFKLARAAEMGKKFQETHIPKETREQLQSIVSRKKELKTNLKSLIPPGTKSVGNKIETPKDTNPLPVNPSLLDEDYEIVRNDITENLFDDDDEDNQEKEFQSSNVIVEDEIRGDEEVVSKDTAEKGDNDFFPKYEKDDVKTESNKIVETTMDYKTLGDDMDTMAKAYVLGLYDDDLATVGEVIEELDDFEKHNEIVKEIEDSKLHERVSEINKLQESNGKIEEILEDNNPMVVSDIVEHDMDEILAANAIPDDRLDIELNDDTLTTQVALDYTKMRSNMIHKYKGGFKETEKEKEFVRPEGSQRVSRFKAARLGI